MQITVERIENEVIICQTQDGNNFEIPKSVFPTLKEGDIISATVDSSLTSAKKQHSQNRLNSLFNK